MTNPPDEPLVSDVQPVQSAADVKRAELSAWHTISEALRDLDPTAQARILRSVITLFEIPVVNAPTANPYPNQSTILSGSLVVGNPPYSNSEERALSPKEFLHEKRPATDVDKVACLAYYLTHYRNTPHFKTLDLSQLNTEAAQIKFSNAAQAVDNATKAGLLVPAVKGQKQISAGGELYVQGLPDKAAARAAIEGYRRRRTRRPGPGSKVNGGENE